MPRKKQFDREEVLEKAMKVFWDNGYKATSMRMLEKGMGINAYSIYADFESKEQLFLLVLKRYLALNKSVLLKTLTDANGNITAIQQFFHDFIQAVKSGDMPNGCLFANTLVEFGATNLVIAQQLNLFFDLLTQHFTQLLKEAKAKKNIPSTITIDKHATYLVGCTEGLAVTAKLLPINKLHDFVAIIISTLTK